jgi:hypothetical protein
MRGRNDETPLLSLRAAGCFSRVTPNFKGHFRKILPKGIFYFTLIFAENKRKPKRKQLAFSTKASIMT